MEDVTDADYGHVKRVCKDFEMKNLREHQDFYAQSKTCLLGDLFESSRKVVLNAATWYTFEETR